MAIGLIQLRLWNGGTGQDGLNCKRFLTELWVFVGS